MCLNKLKIILFLMAICCLVMIGEAGGQKSNQLCKKLMEAIKSGNLELVKKTLDRGADVNCFCGGEDAFPLQMAAYRRNLPMVKFLLSRGAKINVGFEGYNALMVAVSNNDLQMVKYLLEQGADPNANEGNEITGSHIWEAIEKGNLEIVKLLLKYGANIQATREYFEERLKMAEGLARKDPDDVQAALAVAELFYKLGKVHWAATQYPEAQACFRRSLDQLRRLEAQGKLPTDGKGLLTRVESDLKALPQ